MATPGWKQWTLRLYEVPFLAAVVGFMLWIRLLSTRAYLRADGTYFLGTDPYYHMRAIIATVHNFPFPLRFDPFTRFPLGTGTGQFGSLFDVAAAGVALIAGGGSPPDVATIAHVAVVFPAYLGALTAIPFYFLARLLVGRVGALLATLALALFPGEFLVRSLAGYTDHHVAEALGMTLAVLGAFAAVEAAARAGPKLEAWRNPRALWRPITVGVLGALAVVFYFLVWPPAILVVGIFGLFFFCQFALDHWRGNDTRYLVFSGVIVFGLAGLLLLPATETLRLNFNTFSLLQPLLCLLLAAGVAVLHYGSRLVRARRWHPVTLPLAGASATALSVFAIQIFAPDLFGALAWGASWVTGIAVKRTTLTIQEAHPSCVLFCAGEDDSIFNGFGIPLYVALLALPALAVAVFWKRRRADLLLLIWSLLILRAAQTQIRFTYYLALTVALGFGYVAYLAAQSTGLNAALARYFAPPGAPATGGPVKGTPGAKRGRRAAAAAPASGAFKWTQFAAVGAVGLLVLPGLVLPIEDRNGKTSYDCEGDWRDFFMRPGYAVASCNGVDSNHEQWNAALKWLDENTPEPRVDLTTLHARPAPGETFEYAPGTYGVLSWWDYGHWIELNGHRIPVANPFQQNAPLAAKYFTLTDEASANALLDEYTAQNPSVARDSIRYVMIDDEMAAGKFGAINVWAGTDMYAGQSRRYALPDQEREANLPLVNDEMMLRKLYTRDGADTSHYRLVHETDMYSLIGSIVDFNKGSVIPTIFRREAAKDFTANVGTLNVRDDRDLTPSGRPGTYAYNLRSGATVKTFERVPGATLVGETEPNGPIEVALRLIVQDTGREVVYQYKTAAGPDGKFAVTVPYATRDYLTPAQGATNTSVRAQGAYIVVAGVLENAQAPTAQVHVTDRQTLDGDTVQVRFERP